MTSIGIRPTNIIVGVDDDPDDVDLLRLLLRKAGIGHPLELYGHGEEIMSALSKFAETSLAAVRPLLCFLDVRMPAITGHDVLKWIRSQRVFDPIPVVMLSSSDHPEDIKQAVKNGAQCYLSKYPQPAVLREVIDEAERFAVGTPAGECFRMPTNLLLVRARRV
jgi:CheY-like chemotaxis protein